MYKMFFPSGNAEEFCDHVFRTFDMDKNGYIDFKFSLVSFCHYCSQYLHILY
uniref:EF-hand domain-containing protein n=1 Tax=Megaselia scalaris TaxID=36166 RepID=T1GYD0_MEGSC